MFAQSGERVFRRQEMRDRFQKSEQRRTDMFAQIFQFDSRSDGEKREPKFVRVNRRKIVGLYARKLGKRAACRGFRLIVIVADQRDFKRVLFESGDVQNFGKFLR